MPYLSASGRRLHYETIAGDGPTLVLLHHGIGCVELWHDIPERLAQETGCPIFTYSRHGYGKSEACIEWPRPWDYMLDEAFNTLPQLMDGAGLNDVILVGHSDGATIAAAYAGKVGTFVRGLVVIAPHFFVEEVCVSAITEIDQRYVTQGLKEKMERYHGFVDGAFYGWSKSWLQPKFRQFDTQDYLPTLKKPVLGIQGRLDEYGTMAQLDALEAGAGGPVELV